MAFNSVGRQRLDGTRAPFIPYGPPEYNPTDHDYFINLLRMYFIQIDLFSSALLDRNGARYLEAPNGLFFNTASQTLDTADVAKAITYNTPYLINGISLRNNSEIVVEHAGVYNFQFSGQLTSTNSSSKIVYVWIKRNNIDLGYSALPYTISGSGTRQTINWSFDIYMQAGDYLELEWASANTNVSLQAVPPTAPHPGISSSVLTINYISPLPPVLPTPS